MRSNKKMLAVTVILAAGILAGCGGAASSSSVAGSAAGSMPASSETAPSESVAQNTVDPIVVDETIDALQNGDSAYKVNAAITNVSDDSVTLQVYGHDAYEPDDLAALQAGDIIRAHNEETGELEDVTIDSIEQDEYGDYAINGGLENDGIDLIKDRGVFRTRSEDDYPVYYEIGEVTLPFAEDVTLEDSSASPTASEQQSTGMADVARDIADSDNWTVYNTSVFVQDGHVYDIQRVWVP